MSLSALAIAREVFPDRTDDDLEDTLWNRTGFPCFWPLRFKTAAGALRWQLKAYKRAVEGLREGEALCLFCNTKAIPGEWECRRCARMLDHEQGD